jgi:predicted nucleic acid-binding Zn ribbon protein
VPRETEEEADAETSAVAPAVRGKEQRRHMRMGVVWVLLGVFLLVSTYLTARRM